MSAEGKDFLKVAKTLVDELSVHYHWGNVALFRADEGEECFRLLYQKNHPNAQPIPKGYTQPLRGDRAGVLGIAYNEQKDINSGNVKEDFKDIYISPWKKIGGNSEDNTGSELCLRLATGHACFILNIEDPSLNTFSDRQVNTLKDHDQAEAILERSWLYHSLKAALDYTSDRHHLHRSERQNS